MVHPRRHAVLSRGALLMTLIALLAFTGVASVTPSAKAADSPCSRNSFGVQCVRFYVNKAGKEDSIVLTIKNRIPNQSESVSFVGGRGHVDGSSDRKGRWWRDLGPRRFHDRHQYKYWRACALSVSDNWSCTPWVWAGPGVK
jgi:hypothetical protein